MPWRGRWNDARTAFQRRVQRRGRLVSTTRPGRPTMARQSRPAKPSDAAGTAGLPAPAATSSYPAHRRLKTPLGFTGTSDQRPPPPRAHTGGQRPLPRGGRGGPEGQPAGLPVLAIRFNDARVTHRGSTTRSTTRAPRTVGSATPAAASSNFDRRQRRAQPGREDIDRRFNDASLRSRFAVIGSDRRRSRSRADSTTRRAAPHPSPPSRRHRTAPNSPRPQTTRNAGRCTARRFPG